MNVAVGFALDAGRPHQRAPTADLPRSSLACRVRLLGGHVFRQRAWPNALFQLGAVHARASPPTSSRPRRWTCGHSKPTATVAFILYTETGRQEQAGSALATAIELYCAMAMTSGCPRPRPPWRRRRGVVNP